MAQIPPRFCPRCGAPGVAGQRFCANCGLDVTPAPAPLVSSQPSRPMAQAPQQTSQPVAWAGPMPAPATPYPSSRGKRSLNRTGFVLVLFLVLLFIGIGAYAVAGVLGIHLPGLSGGNSSNSSNSGSGAGQPSVTTMRINATTTYAGVAVTILTAQQSQSFIDDPQTATTGMVRLHIQEQNTTSTPVGWTYTDIAHLLLPGKRTVAPTFVQANTRIAPSTTQQSFLDFAVPTSMKMSSLTLRLGAVNEAQIDIPLTGHADLSKYAPKTLQINAPMAYLGLNWTLVSATSQLSIAGQQASKDMVYIVVTLKVDSTLTQEAIPGSAFEYMRLKSGSATASPTNTTLPVSFDAGATGKTGTVTFLVPQGSAAFTLLLLSQGGADAASTDFQLS